MRKIVSTFKDKDGKTILTILSFLIVFKILFLFLPFDVRLSDQLNAISWTYIFIMILLGMLGYIASRQLKIPKIWDLGINNFQRFIIPSITGLLFAFITIYNDFREHLNHPYQLTNKTHVIFPASIPFYSFGAIFLEILLRLFGISVITWMFSHLLLRKKFENIIFWIAAFITSTYEILPYIKVFTLNSIGSSIFSFLFFMNMVEAYEFKKFGLWAPLIFRLSFYIAWHIVWGSIITKS